MAEGAGYDRQPFVPNLFERAKQVTFDIVLAELDLLDRLQVAGDEIPGMYMLEIRIGNVKQLVTRVVKL